MTYVFIAIAVAIVVIGTVINIRSSRKIYAEGIEADAVVSRIETDTDTDSDGSTSTTETCYITYQDAEGRTVEARLGNPPAFCFVGTQLRVKYLPKKPKYALHVKE